MKQLILCLIVWMVANLMTTPASATPHACSINDTALTRTIIQMDSLMFAAFNAHDAEKLMGYFTEDLEFYHDKGGLDLFATTRKNFMRLFENNANTGLRRNIVAGSMEVYPIAGYGAVATQLHRFCHMENGKEDCGTFKNIMLWKKTADGWKVSRVISYDH